MEYKLVSVRNTGTYIILKVREIPNREERACGVKTATETYIGHPRDWTLKRRGFYNGMPIANEKILDVLDALALEGLYPQSQR